MNSKFLAAALLVLLGTASNAFAADSDGTKVSIETTSVGNVGQCEAQVSRNVKVCDANDKCRRMDLGDETSIVIPKGGSFVVTASVSYMQDGVIHGDAAVDRFESVTDSERLVQSLKTGERCSQVFSYELQAH